MHFGSRKRRNEEITCTELSEQFPRDRAEAVIHLGGGVDRDGAWIQARHHGGRNNPVTTMYAYVLGVGATLLGAWTSQVLEVPPWAGVITTAVVFATGVGLLLQSTHGDAVLSAEHRARGDRPRGTCTRHRCCATTR